MTVPAPHPPDYTWVGWLLMGLGIAVNFGFNVFNLLRTNALKKRDNRVDEFKRLRSRLDTALDELAVTANSLRGLAIDSSPKAKWAKKLEELNTGLAGNLAKVNTVLGHFSTSPFISGSNWEAVTSPHLDNALSSLNGGYNTTVTVEQRRAAVGDAASHVEALVAAIHGALDRELSKYASVAS